MATARPAGLIQSIVSMHKKWGVNSGEVGREVGEGGIKKELDKVKGKC